MEPTEIADVLDRTADELLIQGWKRGDSIGPDGSECLLRAFSATGAVSLAGDVYIDYERCGEHDAVKALADYLIAEHGADAASQGGRPIGPDEVCYVWNDEHGRTWEQVNDALRGCAKALREQAAR